MAVQQLTQPIVNPIAAFDATRAHTINFTVIGGAQVVGNRLVISDNETGTEIYNNKQLTMKLEHTIPAGTLSNGGYYNAVIYTVDNSGAESVASTAVPFYCYSQPVLTIDNIPQTETIENGTYAFVGSYLQQEDEPLNSYQYTLYNSNKEVLSQSALIYYEADNSLSYTFVGMSNDTAYYISLTGETVNGTKITSGLRYFTVRYLQPASFAICDLVNNCEDGYIQISSNIVAIDGKSNPDPPVYIDDKEVDLREPDTWVRWNEGFRIQNDFTMRVWGRDFNPYEKIITLTNDINTTATPNKIELKWMLADVVKELPTYVSAKGLNVNLTDSKIGNIENLTIGGNSVEDKDNITKFIIDGNSEQETTEGYNLCYSTTISSQNLYFNIDKNAISDKTMTISFITDKDLTNNTVYLNITNSDDTKENSVVGSVSGNANARVKLTFMLSDEVYSKVQSAKSIFFYIYKANAGFSALEQAQINLGNDKSYEPYTGGIPSPNPDYPQEIEVIDGCNLFDFNKQYSSIYKANVNVVDKNTFAVTSTYLEANDGVTYILDVKKNMNYCLNGEIINGNFARVGIQYRIDSSSNWANYATVFTGVGEFNYNILTNSYSQIRLLFYSQYDKVTEVQNAIFKCVQLTEGSTVKPYLPYGNIGLKQTGKNIFDGKLSQGYDSNGTIRSSNQFVCNTNLIDVKPSAQYVVSNNLNLPIVSISYYKDGTFVRFQANIGLFTITIPADVNQIRINFYKESGLSVSDFTYINFEEGTIATAYEPYREKIIPIDLQGNTLAKVGDIKDRLIVHKNGEVEIEKNIGKITINIQDTFTLPEGALASAVYPTNRKSSSSGLCNRAIQKSHSINRIDYFYSNPVNFVFVGDQNDTEESFKEKYNGAELYYQITSPQIIKLPNITPITTWEGTNIFTPITNLDTTMTTNYGYISVGDIKNLIDVSDFNITYEQGYSQETNTQFLLKPNYIYTLSFDYNVNDTTTDIYYSVGYGINSYEADIQLRIQYQTLTNGRNSVSFTVPGTIPKGSYLWVKFAQTIILADINVDISKIQLESGNKSTDYQSPTLYNIYPTSASKNLYDYDSPIYIIKNNIIYSSIQNGYNITPQNSTEDCDLAIGYKNLLVPGNTYAISFNQLGNFKYFKLYTTDKNSQEKKQEIEINNGIFVAPDGSYDLQLVFAVDNSLLSNSLEIWNVQIEANNIITEYENYVSNSSIITLDEPLRSSGDRNDLICLESPNVLNHETLSGTVTGSTTYYLNQEGNTEYHIWYYNNEGNLIKFIDEEGHEASGVVGIRGAFTTHKECVKITITKGTDPDVVDVTSEELLNNEVIISKGNEVQAYYPYVSVPSLIRYCKEENDTISVLDTPVVYDLSIDNQNALKVLKTYSPISNVFTNNALLGNISLDYINNYEDQETKNAYVLLKCWNANSMPYVIHSNYIDIPEDTSKVFIWMRRKNNLFDLQIEDLGDYNEDDKPIDTDKPVVVLDIDLNNVTQTTIPVTVTAIDETGLRTMRFSKDNGTSWDEVIPIDGLSSSNSYTFENLNPDTTYTIRAEAIDLSGNIGGISQQVKTKS